MIKNFLYGVTLTLTAAVVLYITPIGCATIKEVSARDPIIKIGFQKPHCTATVIDSEFALTAAHCVDVNQTTVIFDLEGKPLSIGRAFVSKHPGLDVAVVQGDFKGYKKMEVEHFNFNLVEGRRLRACGFPFMVEHLVCSELQAIGPFLEQGLFFSMLGYRASGWVIFGHSGSAVVDLDTGKIVGVISGILPTSLIFSPVFALWDMIDFRGQ